MGKSNIPEKIDMNKDKRGARNYKKAETEDFNSREEMIRNSIYSDQIIEDQGGGYATEEKLKKEGDK